MILKMSFPEGKAVGRSSFVFLLLGALGFACTGSGEADAEGGGASAGVGGSGNMGSGGGSEEGTGGSTGAGGTSVIPDEPPRWTVSGVTTWRGDATGAYTIFHDDTCNGSVDNQLEVAEPALTARGLVASFGAIAKDCDDRNLWDELEVLRSHGHEIANHSFTHENLTDAGVDLMEQIDEAHALLTEHLTDFVPSFFIFPYDAFNDDLLDRLRGLNYLGARAGSRGLNAANFSDPFAIRFDVYGPGYSVYVDAEGTPCEGTSAGDNWSDTPQVCRAYVMNQYVLDLISEGGYGIRELHSLENEAWEPIPTAEYEAHLDFLVQRVLARDLWVTTASDAIRYRFAREACELPTVSGDRLLFGALGPECVRYATALTFRVSPLSGVPASVSATQGDAAVPVIAEAGGTFLVTADPSLGTVTLALP